MGYGRSVSQTTVSILVVNVFFCLFVKSWIFVCRVIQIMQCVPFFLPQLFVNWNVPVVKFKASSKPNLKIPYGSTVIAMIVVYMLSMLLIYNSTWNPTKVRKNRNHITWKANFGNESLNWLSGFRKTTGSLQLFRECRLNAWAPNLNITSPISTLSHRI